VVSCVSGQNALTIFIRKAQNAPNVARRDVYCVRASCRLPVSSIALVR